MGVEDEVSRHATVVVDKSKKEGTEEVPKAVRNPSQAGEVKAVPEIGMKRPMRNVSIMARRATRRVSVGRSVLIWVNLDPDPGEPNKEISKTRTTSKGQKDRKPERGQPL